MEGIAGTEGESDIALRKRLAVPNDRRMWDIFRAFDRGWTIAEVQEPTKMDPWFLRQFAEIVELKREAAIA
jgi:carbamoyl-phosphate synthase large subunit